MDKITFIIDKGKTWEEVIGLRDTEDKAEIASMIIPNGSKVPLVKSIIEEESEASYSPRGSIYCTDNIIIGNTYLFTT